MYIWCKIINNGQICPNGSVDAPALTIDIFVENFVSTCTDTDISKIHHRNIPIL